MSKFRSCLLAALAAVCLDVSAATFTVTRTDDRNIYCDPGDCSLREAVARANAVAGDDFIEFAVPLGSTITLTNGALTLSSNVNIAGPGQAYLTVTGNSMDRVFTLASGSAVTVSKMTLADGVGSTIMRTGGTGELTLDRVTMYGGTSGSGGAVYIGGGNATITNSTFHDNLGGGGGAIHHSGGGTMRIQNCVFYDNVAEHTEVQGLGGGAIFAAGTIVIVNSTFTGNTSGYAGGAIYYEGASPKTLTVRNCTISGNSATLYAGGIGNLNDSGGTVANNIIALNTANQFPNYYDGGSIVEASNYMGNTPGLAALADNGGPTLTMALLPGSPALDAANLGHALDINGNTLTTDQRGPGFARLLDGPDADASAAVDLGAFEYGTGWLVVTKTADTLDGTCDADCSLREAVVAANTQAGSDVITFLPSLAGQTINVGTAATITQTVTIQGLGHELLTISGGHVARIFNLNGGSNVSISGLTLNDGLGSTIMRLGGGGSLTLDSVRMSGGTSGSGGAVHVESGDTLITNSTFHDNLGGSGGAVHQSGGGTMRIQGSTFYDNVAEHTEDQGVGGGAIYADGTLVVANSTFTGNTSGYAGGAIYFEGGGLKTLTVRNSTISGNSATLYAGGIGRLSDGGGTIANNIISLNTAAQFPNYYDGGSMSEVTNYTGNAPNLGPLADNGGPTMTMALLCASPALNAGTHAQALDVFGAPLTTDQRGPGFARAASTVDIGAYEAQTTPSCAPLLTATKTVGGTLITGGTMSYTVTLTNTGGGTQPDNVGHEFTDSVPAGVTVTSVSATSGTAANVGNDVNWNGSLAVGASVTITINGTINAATGATVTNQGAAAYDADLNGSNETSVQTDDPAEVGPANPTSFVVQTPVALAATKTVSGSFTLGTSVTYTITITNNGGMTQADLAGDELVDVVPSSLSVTAANGTSGATTRTGNTVRWNGSLAAGASVTITIDATITSIPPGGVISNQGTLSYDSDANGSNEATAPTDDPGQPGAADPTVFTAVTPPSITATKTVSGSFVPGGAVVYTITLTNGGGTAQPDNASDEFIDVVPAGVTVTSVSATSGTAANAANNVSWNGALAAGANVTITINGTIAAAAGATVSNQGSASYDSDVDGTNDATVLTDDPSVAGATNPTTFTVLTPAVISATKSVSGTFVSGGAVQYTITLTNTGDIDQADNAGAEFTDSVPLDVLVSAVSATSGTATRVANSVSWNGAIAAGASVTITIDATIAAGAGTTVSNQGSASYDSDANGTNDAVELTDDPAVAGADDPTEFTVLTPVSVSATKTVSGTFFTGSAVTYTVTLTNSGGVAQADNAGHEFTDTVPAGVTVTSVSATSGTAAHTGNDVTWNGAIPASGGSVTITVNGTVAAAAGATVSNQGSVSYDSDANSTNDASAMTDDPALPGGSDATEFVVLAPVTIAATKTVAGTFITGGAVTYTVTITNSGDVAQPDNAGAEFNDVVPAGVTVTSVNATSGTATRVGNNVTWNGALAASGGSVTITIGGTVAAAAGATVTNQGTVSSDGDANGTNETSTLTDDPGQPGASDPTSFAVVAPVTVTATKSASGTFMLGSTVQYTIALSNAGGVAQPDNAGHEFTDLVPSSLTVTNVSATSGTAAHAGNNVTWNGSIPASSTVTLTIDATIDSVPAGGVVVNQGSAAYDSDSNGTNETAAPSDDPSLPGASDPTSFTVITPVAVRATKSVAGTFLTGGTMQYLVTLTNNGSATQNDNAGDEFTDAVPAGVTVTSVSATAGTAAHVGNNVTWNGTLAGGASVTITINGTVAAAGGSTVTNQGQVAYDADGNNSNETVEPTDDPAQPGNTDATSFVVTATPVLNASKTASGTFFPGSTVQYTILIANSGGNQPDNAGHEFTDAVPAGVTVTGVNATGGTAAHVGNSVTWNGALPGGASVTITIDGTVAAAAGATVSNQGTVAYDSDADGTNDATLLTDDPSLPGSDDPTTFMVVAAPSVTATKSATGTFILGSAMQYTIVLTNEGGTMQPDNATDEFTDVVPAALSVTSVSATSGTASHTGNNVSWNGALNAGASVTITINATIDSIPPGGIVTNQGTVFSDTDNNGSNESSAPTDDPSLPGIDDPTSFAVVSPVSIAATKTVSGTFMTGGAVQYTIALTNNGGVAQGDNAGDEFTDIVPAGVAVTGVSASSGAAVHAGNNVRWNGSLAASGGSVTITIDGTVTAAAGATISNQGMAAYDADANATNEASTPTDDPGQPGVADPTSFTVGAPAPLLSATKSVSGTFYPGSAVQYTIVITNSGGTPQADNAGNEFTDAVPAGVTVTSVSATSGVATHAANNVTWNGSLAASSSVTVTMDGTIAAAAGATVSNQGTVSFDGDANGTNDSSALTDDPGQPGAADPTTFIVLAPPAIAATKSVSAGPYLTGAPVQYTVVLTNNGGVPQPDNATAEFTDAVPAGVTVTSVNATSGTATHAGNNVTWNGSLAASGGTVTIVIDGVIAASAGATVSNQGTAFFDADSNGTNESSTLTGVAAFTVAAPPLLTATKVANGPFVTGGPTSYTITITNTGGVTQPDNGGNEFSDAVPAGLTVTSVAATAGAATHAGNNVAWNGALAPGASVTITINATIGAAPGVVISNQGTTFFDPDLDGSNDAQLLTDDPSAGGGSDATSFTVIGAAAVASIPTLDPRLLMALAALLAFAAMKMMQR